MTRALRWITCVLSLVAVSGCAKPSITIGRLEPCKSMDAARLKKVAVVPFQGRGGTEFSNELEGLLASIRLNDRQYFEVVNRSMLDQVMSEMKLGQSGLLDPTTIAGIGKIVGAKGIYFGQITASKVVDSKYTEERSRCSTTDSKGNCQTWSKYNVDCTRRKAILNVTPKLVEVETSRIVYSEDYSLTKEVSRCADATYAIATDYELIKALQGEAKERIRKDVAPYSVLVQIKLLDTEDGLRVGGVERFRSGLEFAKNKRFDRACEIWKELVEAEQSSYALLHNVGVCYESAGDLDKALQLYSRADRLTTKPDDVVGESLARIRSAMLKREKIRNVTVDEQTTGQ